MRKNLRVYPNPGDVLGLALRHTPKGRPEHCALGTFAQRGA